MAKASEWKAAGRSTDEVVDLALPSGVTIRARRPGPLQLAAWEQTPALLSVTAMRSEGRAAEITTADAQQMAAFWRELLVYCCVSPRVSLEARGEDEIHPRDIPEADWRHIVHWAMRVPEAEKLRPFRGERGDGGAGGDGQDVRVPAE